MKTGLIIGILTFVVNNLSYAASQAMPARPADDLPAHILDACDLRAKAFGAYEAPIDAAVSDLSALGVFLTADFRDVKIGFCDLKAHNGPVGSTSCERDIVLLDKKYRHQSQRLVLGATLAHEMKHYLQHQSLKAEFGAAYCNSDTYAADKLWMEAEADAFGDAVGALLFTGRNIEVINDCPTPVSVHLGADQPVLKSKNVVIAAPHERVETLHYSATKFFPFFAQTEMENGIRRTWRGAPYSIGLREVGPRRLALTNASREDGPFILRLSCADQE